MNKEYVLQKLQKLMPDDTKRPMGVSYVDLKNAVQDDRINYFKTLNGVTVYLKDSKL